MKEILALMALFGSGLAIGTISGALLQEWRLNRVFDIDPTVCSCDNCLHGDLDWDEEPCDGCGEDHDCWEAKDEDN